MKTIIRITIMSLVFFSCEQKTEKGEFKISGEIKNAPDQTIFLEQMYFNQNGPEVLDSVQLKNGKFTLSAIASEQGLYHLRMETSPAEFIFINDEKEIILNADAKKTGLEAYQVTTGANKSLKNFLANLEEKISALNTSGKKLSSLQPNDSAFLSEKANNEQLTGQYRDFITRFVDTSTNPVTVMFALGFTQGIDPALLGKTVTGLTKRFPAHKGIEDIVARYNEYVLKMNEPKPVQTARPAAGSMAPDFTMNDTEGAPFTLSSLKGKYVLVDFWASWCGPCRGENPNVVAAYNKFKTKNFTVLGVSLDEDKQKWLDAIKKDQLDWKQVSDLKQWSSAAVGLYGFDGIPYNVLIDPSGKIIASELRGEALHEKLSEVLK